MDLDMWKHNATRDNVATLQGFGNVMIPPGTGELASGLHGEGRMAEPEEIFKFINRELKKGLPLVGHKIVVTAGPTYEAIDPVRFIGNHSSGKMGFAIAGQLYKLGADVVLIAGPTALHTMPGIKRIDVTSAADMLQACLSEAPNAKAVVMSAAVADYTPVNVSAQKIKKNEARFSIDLQKTTDILKTLGAAKAPGQILVGFALETNDEEANALGKLQSKNLDLIVLNSLNDKGAGFAGDTNKVTLIDAALNKTIYDLKSKDDVARDICTKLVALITA